MKCLQRLREFLTGALVLLSLLHCQGTSGIPLFSVLVSEHTPRDLRADFEALASDLQYLYVLQVTDLATLANATHSSSVLIDALYLPLWSLHLRSFAGDSAVVSGNGYSFPGQMRLFQTNEHTTAALAGVIRWMQLTKIAVFESPNAHEKLTFEEYLGGMKIEYFQICGSENRDSIERVVRTLVQSQGHSSVALSVSRKAAFQLVSILSSSDLFRSISDIICTDESALALLEAAQELPDLIKSRVIYVVAEGCEAVRSNRELLLCRLTQLSENLLRTDYSVLMLRSRLPEVLGKVRDGQVVIPQAFSHYKDNASATFPTLYVSFNNGTVNPSGEAAAAEPFDYAGVQVAVSDINFDAAVLPYHLLSIFNVSLGLFEFNTEWAISQLKDISREDLGVAMLTGSYSSVAIGVYGLLQSLNITLPQIGAGNTSPKLSSLKEFPLYTRVAMSDAYLSVLYGRMLDLFGWKNIVILYCEDTWSAGLYRQISAETQRLGIATKNREEHRLLPTEMTGNYTEYIDVYKEVIDTNVRVVIMLLWGQTLYKSLEAFYDLGMRGGDLFFLATEWLDPSLFEVSDEKLRKKIKELCNGVVQFYPAAFVGTVGSRFAEHYREAVDRDPSFSACFYYDATYMIANAVDYLIEKGADHTSSYTLDSAIRKTRFRGCTGIVTLAEGTNDRYPMMYDIMNSQVFANGSFQIKTVGTYDPAGLVLFNFTSPIIWPDNSTTVPTDLRGGENDCPFEEKFRSKLIEGIAAHAAATSGTFLVGVAVVGVALKWLWKTNAEPLTRHCEISFDDYVHFTTIGVRMLQYMSLGPPIPRWTFTLFTISNMSTLNLAEVISLRKGVYWLLLICVCSSIVAWVLLIVAAYFRLDKNFGCLCARLTEYGEKILPLLGNICFLPIVCTLLSVFDCEDAVTRQSTPTLSDTVLHSDCYVHCWRMPHTAYVCSASFLLLIYLPTSILLRPYWQQRQLYLHISTSPRFLMLQTTFELFLVLLRNTLRYVSELVHSIIFSVSVSVFLTASLATKPYGYRRSNLWHSISLLILQWYSILSTMYRLADAEIDEIWSILLYSAITMLVVFGVVWQAWKVPAMLHRRQGVHVVELFHFMFSRGTQLLYIFQQREQLGPLQTASLNSPNSQHFRTTT